MNFLIIPRVYEKLFKWLFRSLLGVDERLQQLKEDMKVLLDARIAAEQDSAKTRADNSALRKRLDQAQSRADFLQCSLQKKEAEVWHEKYWWNWYVFIKYAPCFRYGRGWRRRRQWLLKTHHWPKRRAARNLLWRPLEICSGLSRKMWGQLSTETESINLVIGIVYVTGSIYFQWN